MGAPNTRARAERSSCARVEIGSSMFFFREFPVLVSEKKEFN